MCVQQITDNLFWADEKTRAAVADTEFNHPVVPTLAEQMACVDTDRDSVSENSSVFIDESDAEFNSYYDLGFAEMKDKWSKYNLLLLILNIFCISISYIALYVEFENEKNLARQRFSEDYENCSTLLVEDELSTCQAIVRYYSSIFFDNEDLSFTVESIFLGLAAVQFTVINYLLGNKFDKGTSSTLKSKIGKSILITVTTMITFWIIFSKYDKILAFLITASLFIGGAWQNFNLIRMENKAKTLLAEIESRTTIFDDSDEKLIKIVICIDRE